MYDSVMVLRCLHLKETQPAQWQQLMKLQSHSVQRKESGLEDIDRSVIVRYLIQFQFSKLVAQVVFDGVGLNRFALIESQL